MKNKDTVLNIENDIGKNGERTTGLANSDMDVYILKWFKKQCRDNNIPISGPIMRAKAEHFAFALGIQVIKPCTGWLNGFKCRNNVSFKAVCGESGAVDIQPANEKKKTFKRNYLE